MKDLIRNRLLAFASVMLLSVYVIGSIIVAGYTIVAILVRNIRSNSPKSHNELVLVRGTYSGMDEDDSPTPSIAMTCDKLEHFKKLLLSKMEKSSCKATRHLYVVVEYDRQDFLLQCITTAKSHNPYSPGEALMSVEAAKRLGIEERINTEGTSGAVVFFKRMEMLCKEDAQTTELAFSYQRNGGQTEVAPRAAIPAVSNKVLEEIEGLVPEDL